MRTTCSSALAAPSEKSSSIGAYPTGCVMRPNPGIAQAA